MVSVASFFLSAIIYKFFSKINKIKTTSRDEESGQMKAK